MRVDAPPLEHAATGLVVHATANILYAGRVVNSRPVPVVGREVRQADQDVPERLDVSLPRVWEGITLDPSRKGGLLGCDGHQLSVTVHLATVTGDQEWHLPRGRFLVQNWSRDGASVRVMGHGLLQLVKDHLRARPGGVAKAAPIAGELMKNLAQDGLETWVHPDLPARSVPAGFTWGEDRFKSMMELVTAWPARVRVDHYGRVCFLPPLDNRDLPGAGLTWRDEDLPDGTPGTIVGAPVEGTRDGTYNHVIVVVKPEGDAEETVVEDHIREGRLGVSRYGWATAPPIQSDAITSVGQGQLVAINELARAGLRARTVPVEMVPDWRVELDDPARAVTVDGFYVGRVTGTDMPLSSQDGPARAEIGVVD